MLTALIGVAAPAPACEMQPGAGVAVVSVARTGEVVLADGRVLRLAGLVWPAREEVGARRRAWQGAERLARGAQAHLAGSGARDRWGRLPALVFLTWPDGPPEPVLLQGALVARGLAPYWPDAEAAPCRDRLMAAESAARAAVLGRFVPVTARARRSALKRTAAAETGRRVVQDGTVRSVREGRAHVFVSFSGARATTPYLSIPRRDLERWRHEGLDPATFSGKRLRVRGMLSRSSSWRLDVIGPQAVEVLE